MKKTIWEDKVTLVDAEKLNNIEDNIEITNNDLQNLKKEVANKNHTHTIKEIELNSNDLFCTNDEKNEWNKNSENIKTIKKVLNEDIFNEDIFEENLLEVKKICDIPNLSLIEFGKYQVESEPAEPIVFLKADNNHYKDSDNPSIVDHVTLITEKIIDLRGFDASEPNNSDSSRKSYGNNRYSYSNQRQWLNSKELNWFSKTHNADEPPTNSGTGDYNTPYDTKAGFLNLFTTEEISNIVPTNLKVAKANVDGGGSEIVNDKVFLLSETEVRLGNENGIAEGKVFSIFSDDSSRCINLTEQCFNNTKSTSKPSSKNDNWYWWLRTPNSSYSYSVRYVNSDGLLDSLDARYGNFGVRPALNLNAETLVSYDKNKGRYVVVSKNKKHCIKANKVFHSDGNSIESKIDTLNTDIQKVTEKMNNIDVIIKNVVIKISNLEHSLVASPEGVPSCYRYTYNDADISNKDVVDINFEKDTILKGYTQNILPVTESIDKAVYIYSFEVLTNDLNATMVIQKGVVNETLPPQIKNLSILSGNAKLDLTWSISDTTYLNGYVFTVKADSVPSNANDGIKYNIDKNKTSCTIDGLNNDTKYYVRPFPYNSRKQYQSEYIVGNGTPLDKILASSLPIGSKIKFGKYQIESETPQPIVFIKADNNHYKDSDNPSIIDHVTLIAEKIIDLRAFDAMEPNNSDSNRQQYGNNNYKLSNQRQWLNSKESNWFNKTHGADEPPTNSGTNSNTGYDTKAGFLNLFSQEELNTIVPTNLKVAKASVDGSGSEVVNDKVFLLSETEVGLGNENGIVEGKVFSIFSDNASRCINLTEQCFNNTKSSSKPSSKNDNWYWWLRTPYSSDSYIVRDVRSDGSLNNCIARYGTIGVRPALNLNANTELSKTKDSDGCYTLI